MSGLALFTNVHVLISIAGILSGLVVLYGLLNARRQDLWTPIFLGTTLATTVTGFFFPFHGFTPAIGVGIVSTVLLAAAIAALYAYRLKGAWRAVYVVCAVASLYFNCFVLVVQLFQKIPALHALAPSGSEPPFAIAQVFVLGFFAVTGFLAVKRFRVAAA
jgi:hypothetical protein